MKIPQIKSLILLLVFAAFMAQPLKATITKVKLQVGSGGPQNLSREMNINNSNSNNSSQLGLVGGFHRLPFRINSSHLVTLTGDWLNTCDRVEILNSSGTIIQTLRNNELTKTTVNGTGQLKFTVPSTRLTGVGNFEIRVRYFIETNGYDVLKCRVVKVGIINFVKWVGPNLPTQTSINGGERSTLIRNVEYKLQFINGNNNGTDFGTAVSLACVPPLGDYLGITSVSVDAAGNTITVTMKPTFSSTNQTIKPNLQDYTTGTNFEFIGMSGEDDFTPGSSILFPNNYGGYVMHAFNTALSTAGDFTNLKEIVVTPPPPPPAAPDLVPNAPSSFGTFYNFGSLTVTDQQGKIYKNIVIPTTPNNDDLGTQLSSAFIIGNSSRCVSKQIGTDVNLGTITLHQILLGTYTCPIANIGNANATTTFTNSFRGNMVVATAQVLPTQAALTRFTTFPTVTTVTQTLPSLNQGITNNNVVNKRMIQVFTFSNRPGAFYCDNAWPLESNGLGIEGTGKITVTVDVNNNVSEGNEGNNFSPF